MAKADSEKQGMVTNVTYVQNQNADTVLNNVRTLADIHNKAGVRLCCGIAQFLIVRAYHMNDQERWNIDRSRDFLKAQLNDAGLKQAMVYRYIATGHELAKRIVKRYKFGGLMGEILAADNENKAFAKIVSCVESHAYLPDASKPIRDWNKDAEHKPRLSMDVLRVNLELDELDLTKQPGYVAPKPDANDPAAALGGTSTPATTVPATKAKPASIVARLKADKDLIKVIPDEIVMAKADVIGREQMAERLVKLMDSADLLKLQAAINARLQELANVKPEEKPEEKPAETLAPTEETAEQGADTITRRSRPRKRKAA